MVEGPIFNGLYDLLLTEDFICSYVIPICGDELSFLKLTIEDYAELILKDKPDLIKEDNFLDELYRKVALEEDETDAYYVLTVSDWHADMNYKVGANKKNCKELNCC